MIFGLADALALFVFAAILVGVGSYVLMRQKMDWRAWAWLSLASMPPAAYFTMRNGGGVLTSIEVMLAVAGAWALYFVTLYVRELPYTWPRRDAEVSIPDPPVEAPEVLTPAQLKERSLAYLLLGIGMPFCGLGLFAFQMLFLPGRHSSALLPIHGHGLALAACVAALGIGLLFVGPGWWLLKRQRHGRAENSPSP